MYLYSLAPETLLMIGGFLGVCAGYMVAFTVFAKWEARR